MTDFAVARKNMLETQVRPSSISDQALLDAIAVIPREIFVPAAHRPLAYMDGNVALDEKNSRFIMEVRVFAKLVQLATIGKEDLVLDVGAGTGYSTAVLAKLAGTVVGLESDPGFLKTAAENLALLDIDNAAVVEGELETGCPKQGPYDLIILEGSVENIPPALFDQLKNDGRLVAVCMDKNVGKGRLFRKSATGEPSHRDVFDAYPRPLPGFQAEKGFVF